MFTTDSTVDLRFFNVAAPIVEDVNEERRVEWLDPSSPTGSRTGTLRWFIDEWRLESIAEARIRVTLDGGYELDVPLVNLMNASFNGGYARR